MLYAFRFVKRLFILNVWGREFIDTFLGPSSNVEENF